MLRQLAAEVLAIYQDLDQQVMRFQRQSGLHCPLLCGRCCDSEKVESSLLECLPLAFALFDQQQGEQVVDQLAAAGAARRCILYDPEHQRKGQWGCQQYAPRPLICRLFGFAGNRDRLGQPRLALCRVMKQADCMPEGAAIAGVDGVMPLFGEAGMRLTALHPGYGARRVPINEALRGALLQVGMFLSMTAAQEREHAGSATGKETGQTT